MKVWQTCLGIFLLGALAVLLVYGAINLPWWTFALLLVVIGICLLDEVIQGEKK